MKYQLHVNNSWIAGYGWTGEVFVFSWCVDRENAMLFDRTQIRMLHKYLPSDCKAVRGEWADRRAPDGIVSLGRRKVRKGGIVKFARELFYHESLLNYVGQYVYVEADGYWIVHPEVFKTSGCRADGRENHICTLNHVKEKPDHAPGR